MRLRMAAIINFEARAVNLADKMPCNEVIIVNHTLPMEESLSQNRWRAMVVSILGISSV